MPEAWSYIDGCGWWLRRISREHWARVNQRTASSLPFTPIGQGRARPGCSNGWHDQGSSSHAPLWIHPQAPRGPGAIPFCGHHPTPSLHPLPPTAPRKLNLKLLLRGLRWVSDPTCAQIPPGLGVGPHIATEWMPSLSIGSSCFSWSAICPNAFCPSRRICYPKHRCPRREEYYMLRLACRMNPSLLSFRLSALHPMLPPHGPLS